MMFLGFAVAVIGGVVAWRVLLASKDSRLGKGPVEPSPEDILKQRYARGEIDDTEFEHRRSGLRS